MDDRKFDRETAEEWIRIIEDPHGRIREKDLYPLLRSWLAGSGAGKVLEVGCGQGACSAALPRDSLHYVGVDPSPFLIRRAQELYPDREFVVGSAYALPAEDTSFDAAFSVAVWHLLGDLSQAARELSRILSDRGSFLLATADPDQYPAWIDQYETKSIEGKRLIGTYTADDRSVIRDTIYLHPFAEIQQSLERAGLRITQVETFRTFIAIRGCKSL